jgi:hypothetical protein
MAGLTGHVVKLADTVKNPIAPWVGVIEKIPPRGAGSVH